MTTQYLLSCTCGQTTIVTASQAGETLRCNCGQDLEVPTMRGLRGLEQVEQGADERPLWTAQQGMIFLGLVIMLAGLAFSAYLYWNVPVMDESLARLEIERLTPAESFRSWRELRREPGNSRSYWVDIFANRINTLWRWIFVGLAVAVAGVVVVAAGFFMNARSASRRRGQPA